MHTHTRLSGPPWVNPTIKASHKLILTVITKTEKQVWITSDTKAETQTKPHPHPLGPTLGVPMSSTMKFCSRGDAVWGKVQGSEVGWGTVGGRNRRTPCRGNPTCAEPLVDCEMKEMQRQKDVLKMPPLNNLHDYTKVFSFSNSLTILQPERI